MTEQPETVEPIKTVLEILEKFEENNPDYFIVAGDHTFDCHCMACITFLTLTGLEAMYPDDEDWIILKTETVDGPWLSIEQVNEAHRLASQLL